ncbi:hypothetical protein ACN38_g8490 [Penicillium nordicum]|uniref:Uncharacterized protein n=1 Tax=Penicillium nordicum TaxID=229535 RepID=A0A0M8NZV4_9EURO|nr:hypothetical protein ACN38_g8490 [Penicillium nordicum]
MRKGKAISHGLKSGVYERIGQSECSLGKPRCSLSIPRAFTEQYLVITRAVKYSVSRSLSALIKAAAPRSGNSRPWPKIRYIQVHM